MTRSTHCVCHSSSDGKDSAMSFRAYLDALEDMTGDSSNLIRPDGKAERASDLP